MTPEQDTVHARILSALEREDDGELVAALADARAADIAEAFHLLPDEARSRLLFALPPRIAAEVIVLLDEALRGEIVDEMDAASISEIVSELQPDDAADVLGELDSHDVGEILEHLVDEQSEQIEGLLGYDESTAGGIMTPDVLAVPSNLTVAEAAEQVRNANPDEDLNEVYIVDDDHRLMGTVPLRKLVTSRPATRLGDLCDPDPVTVYVDDDQETVVQIIRKYDAIEAAVIDRERHLVGRITHDDLLDVAAEEAAEDLYRMAGTDAAELETASVVRAARVRLTWLLPCMGGMLLSATVLKVFETSFHVGLFASLALFVPMIGAIGGNSGIQTSTVIVRGFATGELASTKFLRALLREGRIALLMAPVCGTAAWLLVSAFFPLFGSISASGSAVVEVRRIAIAVGIAMTTAILIAATLGLALPFSFRKFGVDPAIASGPLVTTANDVLSVFIYMTVASVIAS